MGIRSEKVFRQTEILKTKCKSSFPLNMFYKAGNGMITLKERTGRFTDFKGVFVITCPRSNPLLVRSSCNTLNDVQKMIRGYRKEDRNLLKRVAGYFGFSTVLAGQVYLRSMGVAWMEVENDEERLALVRAFASHSIVQSHY